MVNQVLGRILRSERTASLRCPIVKQQRAANAEVIVNLKTVPILLLLGCAGTDCGYPNVRFWRAPCKGGAFQWVEARPGVRDARASAAARKTIRPIGSTAAKKSVSV
jgi:hypothetical protein